MPPLPHAGAGVVSFVAHVTRAVPAELREPVRDLVLHHCQQAADRMPLPDVDVLVVLTGGYISAGGHAFYQDAVTIVLGRSPSLRQLERSVPSTLYHELHHRARIATVGYGATLEESIVTEGLAQHMEDEMGYAGWPGRLGGESVDGMAALFERERKREDRGHAAWFTGGQSLPQHTGYVLGYFIVGDFIARTGRRASQLYDTSASAILRETVDRRGIRHYLDRAR